MPRRRQVGVNVADLPSGPGTARGTSYTDFNTKKLTYAVRGYESDDLVTDWTLRHGGRTTKIYGPLSAALFEAAKITALDKEVKISDEHGGSVFFLRG